MYSTKKAIIFSVPGKAHLFLFLAMVVESRLALVGFSDIASYVFLSLFVELWYHQHPKCYSYTNL